jgi:hypothetical protein
MAENLIPVLLAAAPVYAAWTATEIYLARRRFKRRIAANPPLLSGDDSR